jgi:hypothetical protein
MIWRGPWDGLWDGGWEGGAEALPEGFMRASATIRISGTATITDGNADVTIPGWMTAAATISLGGTANLTDAVAPPIEPPVPVPGQTATVYAWGTDRSDRSRHMTDRRNHEPRDHGDAIDLIDIVKIFDEFLLAA